MSLLGGIRGMVYPPLVHLPPWYISPVCPLPGIPTPLVYLAHGITNPGIPTSVYLPPWYISPVYPLIGIPTPLVYLPHGITNPGIPTLVYLPPRYIPWYTHLSPGIPTPRRDLGPGIPIPVDRHTPVKTLHSRNFVRGQ